MSLESVAKDIREAINKVTGAMASAYFAIGLGKNEIIVYVQNDYIYQSTIDDAKKALDKLLENTDVKCRFTNIGRLILN